MQDTQMVTVLQGDNGKYKILRAGELDGNYYPVGNYTVHESNTLTTPDGELIAKDEHVINYPIGTLFATQWLVIDTGEEGLMVDGGKSEKSLVIGTIEDISKDAYSVTIKVDLGTSVVSSEEGETQTGKIVIAGNAVGVTGTDPKPKGKGKAKDQALYAYFNKVPLHQIRKVKDVFVWKASHA